MANTRHLVAQVEGSGTLFAAGRLGLNGTTLTLTNLSSPLQFTGDMTASRTGVGNYLITIANFKGPLGFAIPAVSVGSAQTTGTGLLGTNMPPLGIACSAPSYSGDTMTMSVSVASAATFTDADVYFHVFAF